MPEPSALDTLGELEELVLLAVVRLADDAYGARIRGELRERAARSVSVGTVYVTLMRMEQKGLVESRLTDPTARRGGKARRQFQVTAMGRAALRASRSVLERMWEGLEDALSVDAAGPHDG